MVPQRAGHLFHRFELAPHRSPAPLVQELGRPNGTDVFPKTLKVFLEQIGSHAPKVVLQQLRQFYRLLFSQILWPFQETPSRVLEDFLVAVGLHLSRLASPDSVDRLAHLLHDVKSILANP